MIRTKGEAGTGNVVEAVRHMRAIREGIRRLESLDDDELPTAAKELRAPLELVKGVAATGQAAGRELLGRRSRDSGGRRADDAARRRGRVRRLRHLQVRRTPPARARAIVHATTHFEDPERDRRGIRHARGSDVRPRRALARRTEPAPASWLVGRRPRLRPREAASGRCGSACSQSRAASRRTSRRWSVSAPSVVEVRRPADLLELDGLVIPGGESTTIQMGLERVRPRPAAAGLRRPRRRPVLGTCAGLIMLDRAHLGLMDIDARRNAFGRQVRSFEADVEVEGLGDEPLRARLHPGAVDRVRRGRRRGPRRARRPPGRRPPGQPPRRRLPSRS